MRLKNQKPSNRFVNQTGANDPGTLAARASNQILVRRRERKERIRKGTPTLRDRFEEAAIATKRTVDSVRSSFQHRQKKIEGPKDNWKRK